jgi:hypothetical protein
VRKLLPSFWLVATLVLAAAGTAAQEDPPGRVGRLSLVEGAVHLHSAQETDWRSALRNWPVTSGDVLYTAPGARAEIRVGSTALRLDGNSELEITRLDDEHFEARLVYGSLAWRLRNREQAEGFVLATPHGEALPLEAGRYRADYANNITAVTAYAGELRFVGAGEEIPVRAPARVELWRAGTLQYHIGAPRHDDFSDWSLARERRDDALRGPRYVSPEMTGHEDLHEYGDWQELPGYGPVWYPRVVPLGWVPYRSGRWVWIDPWGWTWVDDAPWGFAPFHYGRWVYFHGRWAWVPGTYVARPVYAPALVVWIGRPGVSVSIDVGAVGWVPLAPREVFVPAYRCSPIYLRQINIAHVTNVNIIQARRPPQQPANRGIPHAVTLVAPQVVAAGRPVAAATLSPGALPAAARLEPLAVPPVKPEGREARVPRRGPAEGQAHHEPGSARDADAVRRLERRALVPLPEQKAVQPQRPQPEVGDRARPPRVERAPGRAGEESWRGETEHPARTVPALVPQRPPVPDRAVEGGADGSTPRQREERPVTPWHRQGEGRPLPGAGTGPRGEEKPGPVLREERREERREHRAQELREVPRPPMPETRGVGPASPLPPGEPAERRWRREERQQHREQAAPRDRPRAAPEASPRPEARREGRQRAMRPGAGDRQQ